MFWWGDEKGGCYKKIFAEGIFDIQWGLDMFQKMRVLHKSCDPQRNYVSPQRFFHM